MAEHGGSSGIRDAELLGSAMARPLNLAAYDEPDVAALTACYGFGIAQNHAFVDGSRRTALLAVGLFLGLNGKRLVATQLDATQTILRLAAGDLDEVGLTDWIRRHLADR